MNNDEIVSEIYTIDKFFRDKYKYEIPDFQRSYTWELKEINDFLTSINNVCQNKSKLFLGTIYFYQEDNSRFITDGQQRIITWCLIVNALRILKIENSNYMIIDKICKVEVYEASTVFSKLYSISNINEIDALEEELPEYNLTISQIMSNQKTIYDFLKDAKGLKEKFDYAKDNIEMIFLNLPTHYNEFQIFRDINARGKALTNNDVIKSIFFSLILNEKKIPHEKQSKYICWKNIETNLLDQSKSIGNDLSSIKSTLESNLTLSLNIFMSFRMKKYIPATGFKVSDAYEKMLSQKEAESILREFQKFTDTAKYVLYPYRLIPSNGILKTCHDYVQSLNSLGIKQPLPLFLAIYYQMIARNKFQQVKERNILKKAFEKMYIFHFFFSTISSDRPSKIGNIYKKTALEVNENQLNFENMFQVLNANFPSIMELKTKVQRILFYVKKNALKSVEDEEMDFREYKIYTNNTEIKQFLILVEYILRKRKLDNSEFSGIYFESVEHIYNADYNYGKLENFKLMSFLPLESNLNEECNKLGENPPLMKKINVYRKSKYFSVIEFVRIYDGLKNKTDNEMREKWEDYILETIVQEFNELK
ncbi:MAG: DUF262 domain-containing protein [Erysipelotrichaceae bacterium]